MDDELQFILENFEFSPDIADDVNNLLNRLFNNDK